MKVLLIDPWGIRNTFEYLNGLIYGISEHVDLSVVTNHYNISEKKDVAFFKWFFKLSERIPQGIARKIIRGAEYFFTYCKIIKLTEKEAFDVVHINWMLFYKMDQIFVKRLSLHCGKVVYTAHNALPHINGDRKIRDLKKIYETVDTIIVHGQAIKEEVLNYFPNVENKIVIQRHGVILTKVTEPSLDSLSAALREKIKKYKKVLLMCGAIFPNKGTDRIVKIWLNSFSHENALLIIAGQETAQYTEFEKVKKLAGEINNVEIISRYINDIEMNALLSISSIILIPYIHASMSGVIFSAAHFSKPVLCTDVGALKEYLEPGEDSIVCENSFEGLQNALSNVLNISDDLLNQMGISLHNNIERKCNWNDIGRYIIQEAYKQS